MQSSYSNNYGLNNNYEYYEYVFDSSQAQNSYSNAQSKENWPIFAIGGKKQLTNVAAMKVLEVQIPYSYIATITAGSFFTLTEGLNTTNVVIPPNNYTSAQLVTALKTALDAAHVVLGGNPNAFIVGFNSFNRFTFLCFDGGPVQYSFNFADTSAYQSIGFKVGTYTSDISGSLISPFYVNVTGPPYLYVNSNTIGTLIDLFLPQTGNSANAGPQIAKVPVNTNPGGTIYWSDPDPQKWFNVENLSSLQQIDFYLTLGTSTNLLDLQGLPFSIKLGVLLNNTQSTDVSTAMSAVKRIRSI